ncbi:hypothetical protein LGK97_16690 [Clostridium sp. CS001]|uniref:hypothetical protein n=1 Tax=Clostridium sp. CS001 TaxID=2880648 RepID=UPI001CF544B3|nr:hypothetical protein [Clostridium sp. CS001]MCB2291366.1 hypothetical protein [Clostridium sp. CS001]
MKKRLLVCITIMLMLSSACESVEKTSTQRTSNTSNNSVENATVSPGLNINDEVKYIDISDLYTKLSIPVSVGFFIINNDRLILLSEATCFELKKVTD